MENVLVIPEWTEVNFVKFYTAMVEDDANILGVDKDVLEELVFKYRNLKKIKEDGYDRASRPTRLEMVVTRSCLILYSGDQNNIEVLDILRSLNIEISDDPLVTIENITYRLEKLTKKYSLIQGEKPKVNTKPYDAYDILASMSAALEFGLDFKNITVAEYLSYDRVLTAKREAAAKKK